MGLMNGWVTIYEFFILSLCVILGNDIVGYYSILVIFGDSWSLVILVFFAVIYHKTKLQRVKRVKK